MSSLPLVLYFGIGTLLYQALEPYERRLSKIIYFVLIPIVAAHSGYSRDPEEVGVFALVGFAVSCTASLVAGVFSAGPFALRERALLFGYLNIGWFGIPVASGMFGAEGGEIIALTYMGGAVYGMTVAVVLVGNGSDSASGTINKSQETGLFVATVGIGQILSALRRLMQNPALYCLAGGMILRALNVKVELLGVMAEPARWLLTLLGMMLLGSMGGRSRLRFAALPNILWVVLARICVVALSVALVLGLGVGVGVIRASEIAPLGLLAIFPPAANIVILVRVFAGDPAHHARFIVVSTIVALFLVLTCSLVLSLNGWFSYQTFQKVNGTDSTRPLQVMASAGSLHSEVPAANRCRMMPYLL